MIKRIVNLYLMGLKGLESISNLNFRFLNMINCVIIGKDKNVINDYSEKIEKYCKAKRLKYFYRIDVPLGLVNKADLNIAIGWRWIINSETKTIAFHDSLLPKYRGFNPLVSSLINGDEVIGVSAFIANNQYDCGDIVGQKNMKIKYPIKIKEAIEKVSYLFSDLLNDIFEGFASNSLMPISQQDSQATYSLWRDNNDYHIDWSWDSSRLSRFIDAVGYPYKGAFCFVNGRKIIIYDSVALPDINIENRCPGKVIFKNGQCCDIVCGKGLLRVREFFSDDGNQIDLSKFRIRFY